MLPFKLLAPAALLLTACGRYADFTLPILPASKAKPPELRLSPQPVLTRGAPGEWDSADVLNPSVVVRGGVYFNFYSGFNGKTWRTGLAIDGIKKGAVLSPDGATWEGAYIAANGAALDVNGEFYYWYQAGDKASPRIGLAKSADGYHWRKEPKPVLDLGPAMSWDERGAGDPSALRIGNWFYLYYLGQNRARQQRIGLARSLDGVRWEKLRTNPVMDLPWPGSNALDENGSGEPAVWQWRGLYWMLYTGRARDEKRSLGLAHSADGVHWFRDNLAARREAWNAMVLCDPAVIVKGSAVQVWFGGGDRAAPDEYVHGQIGYAELGAGLSQ